MTSKSSSPGIIGYFLIGAIIISAIYAIGDQFKSTQNGSKKQATSIGSQDINKENFNVNDKSIIGVWIESPEVATAYGAMKVVLYTKSNKPYLALIDTDGYIEKSLTEKKVGNSIRYYDNTSAFDEYYIIDNQALKVFDSQGFVATYEKSEL
jgi:hypothetical protein